MPKNAAKSDPENSNDTLYLVDGSGFIFRAYFALPQTLTNPAGLPVGAVLGFCNMMYKLLNDFHAPNIAVIFDAARKNYRNDIYADYKANRDDPPDDLLPQFPLFRRAAEAFGVPAIELEGFEADDVIATYARLAKARGQKVVIVGSDKDMYQLVNDHVQMFDPIKQKYIGYAEVIEKFGVPPEKVVEVQALMGDSIDNIPGVPGIGPKTAMELIKEFGDLETLLSRAGEIKQNKRRETLIEHAENARMSKRLAALDDHVDVPIALEDLKPRDMNSPDLAAFLREQGFNSLLNRIGVPPAETPLQPAEIAAEKKQTEFPLVEKNEYVLINDFEELQRWINEAYEEGAVCIDTETTGITPAKATLVGISLAVKVGRAAYIPLGHTQETDLLGHGSDVIKQLPMRETLEKLKPLLEDDAVLKIAHNMKYDWQMFAKAEIRVHPFDDTMLLSYVLDGAAHSHSMDNLSSLHIGWQPVSYEDVAGKGKNKVSFDRVDIMKALPYAAEDADITLRLHKILKPRLALEKMASVYENIERPLVPVIAQMELNGIRIDPAVLKEMSRDFGKRLLVLEQEIYKLAGTEFNIASPKQVSQILFEQMGLQGGKKTAGGDWSTTADILEKLAAENEIARKILDTRQLAKLKSTYTDSLQEEINPATGRVHTSFGMAHTTTGRLASSDPNLQNIPIRTEEGRKIRTAFVPADGCVLLSVDYSQVELRLAAAMANVKALKQAFTDKEDIHTLTASQVFDTPLDKVTGELRRAAKAVNFGIIYGISGFGLAKQLGTSNSEAADYIRKYLARFPEIQDFMEAAKQEARTHGFVRTHHGRKVIIRGINDKMLKQGAERQAINAPLQGTAADIMKIAMTRMPAALAGAKLSVKMLLQVHDELVFEVPLAEAEKTADVVRRVMERVVDLGVPLEVESGSGASWGAAH
ncbi:MAG: DNA polymerase I [Alphaproteobacteria bacterium]